MLSSKFYTSPAFSSSYSDGFEGKEATPTGIYMPAKHPARGGDSYQKIRIRLGELTIVSERPSGELQVEPRRYPRRNQRRCEETATPTTHDGLDNVPRVRKAPVQSPDLEFTLLNDVYVERDTDSIVVNRQQEEPEAEIEIPKECTLSLARIQKQITSGTVTDDGQMSETPANMSSPLRSKQSALRDARNIMDSLQESQNRQGWRPAENIPQSKGDRISQQLSMISSMEHTPTRIRTESLEIEQELMMVSVQKRPADSRQSTECKGSEGDSERGRAESYSDSESNNEENNEFTPGEDSELGEEIEEEKLHEIMGDGAAENIDTENCLIVPERAISEAHIQYITSDDPEVSTAAEAEQKVPQSGLGIQSVHGACGENSLDTGSDLKHIASQALHLDIPAQFETLPPMPVSLPDNGKRGIKGKDINVSGLSSQHSRSLQVSAHNEHPGSSWRPRIPDKSGSAIGPEEAIVDSPSPTSLQNRKGVRHRAPRRQSAFANQQLTMPEKEPTSSNGIRKLATIDDLRKIMQRIPPVAETQVSNRPEIQQTEFAIVPQMSYMERALEQLSLLNRRPNLTRTKSAPAHVYFAQQEQDGDMMMTCGSTMTGAFQYTVSPVEIASRMPNLLEEVQPVEMFPDASQTRSGNSARKREEKKGSFVVQHTV